nr:hypothetical protein [Candidatus Sigynarchaeota archaeon]
MIRFGESCLFCMGGRCYNKNTLHYERHCPFIGRQFECKCYNGVVPRTVYAAEPAKNLTKKE